MDTANPMPIAIIGSACRFPGKSSSPLKLWDLLQKPRDLHREVPRDRFRWEGVYREDGLHGTTKTKDGYWLDESIREFDPQFFNITPAEAETIDPQHRLLLENVYEAIESAGLTMEDLQGSDTGVYVGLMSAEYYENATHDVDAASGPLLTTGTSRSMASNRISYTFDFRGPSMTIDTACSSSLMAVHLAVGSLRRRESHIAFACGASLKVAVADFVGLSKMNMLSPDGRSKMFDAKANGYGKGEGTAVICLKRLDDAIRDGDVIECVIRETATSQDGRTKGITMPSAKAQAGLIRKTYENAGLDLSNPASRPMYFEAHGTGTPAGDPLEAQAVDAAFFPKEHKYTDDEVVYIGSIKTIIGHTEGTAGIAGLLRAALAVRHGVLPPNLLFTKMNPAVEPFTKHLQLVQNATPWPALPSSSVRRASINSFGFGGSNVHAIVESYSPPSQDIVRLDSSITPTLQVPFFTPLTFSATSRRSLAELIKNYIKYLDGQQGSIDLRALAWTLQYKRSHFSYRCAITLDNHGNLQKKLGNAAKEIEGGTDKSLSVPSPKPAQPRIFGIFTGQGAQWATMGSSLISQSSYARSVISKLDTVLASLPESERPAWNLVDELLAEPEISRINEAALAQPLTTAIQVLLVDMLRVAKVKLHAVIGHSSGEIGAAYAAGLITAEDAIRTAYYRGCFSKHAAGKDGQEGAMLATYLTPEQATQVCLLPEFRDRIVPAVFNSPSIVTLSGDSDAIDEVLGKLELEGTFARKLKVDKAYHSHHMLRCVEPYLQSLGACKANMSSPPADSPIWFSSVEPGRKIDTLTADYWVENLTSPVRFSEAITNAASIAGLPDLFLEFGPHPALEKPVREILEKVNKDYPYKGLIRRSCNSIESVAEALGAVWARFGRSAVDFAAYDNVMTNGAKMAFVKDLPSYPWMHNREYWWESRYVRKRLQNTLPPTELMAEMPSPGTTSHDAKWRCFLTPKDIPWLPHHRLNNQPVLPGAGYIVMAATAIKRHFRKQNIEMIEMKNLRLSVPIAFANEDASIETVLTLSSIREDAHHHVEADFRVDFSAQHQTDELVPAAQCTVQVRFGNDEDRTSPQPFEVPTSLTDIEPDLFYQSLTDIGYGHTGPFQCMTKLQRRSKFSTGMLKYLPNEMVIHPAVLDGLIQATLAAECYPGDTAVPRFRVPSFFRSIKIFPYRCEEVATAEEDLRFDCAMMGNYEFTAALSSPTGFGTVIQVEGLTISPFRVTTSKEDVTMFSEVVWKPFVPNAQDIAASYTSSQREKGIALAGERMVLFYLRNLHDSITQEEKEAADQHIQYLLDYAHITVSQVQKDTHSIMKKEWLSDTEADIGELLQQHPGSADLELLHTLGKAYPSIVRHKQTTLGVLTGNDLLHNLYRDGLGYHTASAWAAEFVSSICSRSPRMRILEVGGGTASLTRKIVDTTPFSSYCFTDISPAFLGPAKEEFKRFADKMEYRVFDMEKDTKEQGFVDGSFELVVASNVLHATENVKAVLQRVRRLLKPGGYLVCVELSACGNSTSTVMMGGFPGWWLGHGKDRKWSPLLTEQQWHEYLQVCGFSGIDSMTPIIEDMTCPLQVFSTQAVDDRVLALRNPLSHGPFEYRNDGLTILGGDDKMFRQLERILSPTFHYIEHVSNLEDLGDNAPIPHAVLSLLELQEFVFLNMTAAKWMALQNLFLHATDVLWVSTGRRSPTTVNEAYGNMMVGLGRVVNQELPHLRLTFLDVDNPSVMNAPELAQAMTRWCMLGQWAEEGWKDEILFPHHPELAIENRTILAPYVIRKKEQNDRFNAQHRRITRDVVPASSGAELRFNSATKQYALREASRIPRQPINNRVSLRMQYSSLHAIKLKSFGYFFVGLGVVPNNELAVVFADSTSSRLDAPNCVVHPCDVGHLTPAQYIHAISASLVTERVVAIAPMSGTTIVLTSDPLSVSLVKAKAGKLGKDITFVSTDPNVATTSVTLIRPHTTDFSIRQSLPLRIAAIMNISIRPDDAVLFGRITAMYDKNCPKSKGADSFMRPISSGYECSQISDDASQPMTSGLFHEAEKSLRGLEGTMVPRLLKPKDLTIKGLHSTPNILDWTDLNQGPVNLRCATELVNFNPMKTYLIIGTSDIAQSIVEWMVERGAKFILMTSRNPSRTVATWACGMSSKGATVHLYAVDITDEISIKKMIAAAKDDMDPSKAIMPSFGGVMHLGLMLKDRAFEAMSFEDLQSVANVKSEGSRILHEALIDEDLDFFIMTSSISLIHGRPGQANYNVGNAYMAGLARYRRNIGLPASVVDLGWVVGLGYLTRDNRDSLNLNAKELRLQGIYPISERDIHHIFAEAVLSSSCDSGTDPEIITGLRDVEPDMMPFCPFVKNPFFAHSISHTTNLSEKTEAKPTVREKLLDRLRVVCAESSSATSTSTQVFDIVREGFLDRISMLLQIATEDIGENKCLLDMGVDSLVATEIGSWSRKELGVQVPQSLILGDKGVRDIVDFVVEKIEDGFGMMEIEKKEDGTI
ncbi:ketoacyl-synt-domain-containing protein [Amniculicola lignicola CBS 123094]|uniref:Ketoacyl-synt-domain-containing protein n=1 Tax=Amniculicola lignicola CBS 123094 TaxID=1392246 RepID=A0A6A5WS92_9PLEO|nr:ketoacyl-synt-domain-containing protein [Amniculicola lignicola CBS 123094]